MYKKTGFLLVLVMFGVCASGNVFAAQSAPKTYSSYGLIQNVQNYSTNSFYNGTYNQKAPQAIYTTGADLTSGDCQRIVENLVSNECARRNNCFGLRLQDVRPTIMVQLSQIPGHNFATSCGGFIDTIFNKYLQQTGGTNTSMNAVVAPVAFPTPSGAKNPNANVQFGKIIPPQKAGVLERTAELAAAQRENDTTPAGLEPSDFPKTFMDLSLADRIAFASEDYEKYKDLKAYQNLNIEDDSSFLARLKVENPAEYCRRRPAECTNGSPTKPTTPDKPEIQYQPADCQTGETPDCAIILRLD